jgi:Transposase DDE domain
MAFTSHTCRGAAPGDSPARARGVPNRRRRSLLSAHCRGQPSRAAPASFLTAAHRRGLAARQRDRLAEHHHRPPSAAPRVQSARCAARPLASAARRRPSQGARRASQRTCDAGEVREQRSGVPVCRWRRLPKTCVLDTGYDVGPIHEACEDRGCRPIIPLRETLAVRRGDHKPPCCEHGEWRFPGSDAKRGASKWRCPTGDCKPASRWVKADRLHPLLQRETPRWRKLYKDRAAVEREFGRLKHQWSLLPLRALALSASSFTPTSRSSPSSPARWRGRAPFPSRHRTLRE